MAREYNKLLDKPKYKLPGIFPSGSIKELGFDRSDLENTSMGSFRIKKTQGVGYWYGLGQVYQESYISDIQGFPALLDGLLLDWSKMYQSHTIISIPDLATNTINGYGVASVGGSGMGDLGTMFEALGEAINAGFTSPKFDFTYSDDPEAHLHDVEHTRAFQNNFTEIFKSEWVDIRNRVDDREDGVYDRNTGIQTTGDVITNDEGKPIKNIEMELTYKQQKVVYDWFNRARIWHNNVMVNYKLFKKNTHAIFGKGEWVYNPNLNDNFQNQPNNTLGRFMGSYKNDTSFEEGHANGYDWPPSSGDGSHNFGSLEFTHHSPGALTGMPAGLYDSNANLDNDLGTHRIRNYNRFRHRVTRGLTDASTDNHDWQWFPGLEFELKYQNQIDVIPTSQTAIPYQQTAMYSSAYAAEYLKQAMEQGIVDINETTGKLVSHGDDFWTEILNPSNNIFSNVIRGVWYMMFYQMGGITLSNWEPIVGDTVIPEQAQQELLWDLIGPSDSGENILPLWNADDQIGFNIEDYTTPPHPSIHHVTGSFVRYRNGTTALDGAPSWYENLLDNYFSPPPSYINKAPNQENNPTTWIKAIILNDGTRLTYSNHEEILYGFPNFYESDGCCNLMNFDGNSSVWSGGTNPPEQWEGAYYDDNTPYMTPQGDAIKIYDTWDETLDAGVAPARIELAYDDQYLLQQELDEILPDMGEDAFEYKSIESYLRYMTMSLLENLIYNGDSHLFSRYVYFGNLGSDPAIQVVDPPGVVIGEGGVHRHLIHYLQMLSGEVGYGFINVDSPTDESGLNSYLSGLNSWAVLNGFPTGLTIDPNNTVPDAVLDASNSVLKAISIGMPSFFFFPQGYYDQFLGFLDYTTYTEDYSVLSIINIEYQVFYNETHDRTPYEVYIETNILDNTVDSDDLEPPLYFVPNTNDENIAISYYKISSPLQVEFGISPYEFTPFYETLQTESSGMLIPGQISEELTLFLDDINAFLEDWSVQTQSVLYSYLSGEGFGSETSQISIDPSESYFMYRIIQWGDEKNLLSDDDILESKYFAPYLKEFGPGSYQDSDIPKPIDPDDNNAFTKLLLTATPMVDGSGISIKNKHVYMRPGVYKIKAVVYRLTPDRNILIDANLIDKNIVIFDNNIASEDFSQFGGTPFNVLPVKEDNGKLNQIIIGGISNESKYYSSISKLKISDNFRPKDFNEEALIEDNLLKINSKLLGEHPGQIDLSTTRFFVNRTGVKNIYDFITDGTNQERQALINNQFNITNISGSILDSAFQPDTFATRIFIDDNENCDIEINPGKSEFFVYHNTTGKEAKGITIGDYKVKQNKDKTITSDPMETPFFENDSDKQAF